MGSPWQIVEFVGTGPPNSRYGRSGCSAVKKPKVGDAGWAGGGHPIQPSPLLFRPHTAMVPEKGSKGKIDPSRASGSGGADIAVGDHSDPAVLQDSAGSAGWRADAVGVGLRHGSRDCNNAVRDHSVHRSRKRRDTLRPDRSADAEPVRRELPCPSSDGVWTTAANHVTLGPV